MIRGHNRNLAREALTRCQDASDWVNDVINRHREKKLHLDRNTKHREITFKVFKPGGDVSIYEFMTRFEEWADDYLSEEAKADQLFHKYLDKSITDSYAELSPLKHDFEGMKAWLIRKFGSVVPMAHGVIKSIAKLAVPRENQLSETVQYLRTVHKLLSNLSELEISRGRPVPKLKGYLGSNAFLTALVNALPNYLTDKFFEDLVIDGVEDSETIEGGEHLPNLISLIKTKYRHMEFKASKAAASTTVPPQNQSGQSQTKKLQGKGNQQTTANVSNTLPPAIPNPMQPVSTPNPPPVTSWQTQQKSTAPPFLTGGNAALITNPRQPSANQNRYPWTRTWDRWACPIRNHTDHLIIQCGEFWSMSPQDRREACRGAGCYTCLDRNRNCRNSCALIASVPPDAVCKDCHTL